MVARCNGCTAEYDDGTEVYHLSEAYLASAHTCRDDPVMLEFDILDMLDETLQ